MFPRKLFLYSMAVLFTALHANSFFHYDKSGDNFDGRQSDSI